MEYGTHGAAIETAYDEVKDHALYVYSSVHEMIEKIINE